ncbi:macrophage mannose receptor 1-like [Polyodon spathula]|uniref:macrophage mannose receptor 1-like n=1 Tax=Polyodon spathula TaxID=7913 RepID=UPI001B7E1D0A|nr:macrophage mannose receptor 1-like [Polyodon spathula]
MFPAEVSVVVCIALALSGAAAQDDEKKKVEKREVSMYPGSCLKGWVSFNSRCYQYVQVKKTWADAELFCLSVGGNLASVHSVEENNFIQNLINKNDASNTITWLGGSDCFKEGSWYWTDGSKWDYNIWNKGEPNNFLVENCLQINYGGSNLQFLQEPVIMFPTAVSVVVCFALALSQTTAQDDKKKEVEKREASMCGGFCLKGWVSFNNQCYQYVKDRKTWADAELFCLSVGGNLASVHSIEENNFIQNLINKNDASNTITWLGGSDCFKEGSWYWTDGSKWDYNIWNKGEPNNFLVENCLQINFGAPGGWNDMACLNLYPFVCVYKNNYPFA